ncbi:cell division protein DivIC [Paenibacillus phyllosphaerae]|uniref:Cell division protein DivIC n=1 Tax=Paenibacillus phyllosphaerae TaxID=274593 RepID=A0A7W5B491_9BACL|nr:septum formation initiator family protein [Paenibacillus phyllosphaerae]MBB3114124.1 cell division protein DivIC [Paenibacillus phyllosphaerae]
MATARTGKSTAQAGTKRRLRIWLLFVVMFMLWASYTLFAQLDSQREAESKLDEVQLKIQVATKQMEDLKLQIDRLNDPEYIQQVARRDQNMIKPGEKSIVVGE